MKYLKFNDGSFIVFSENFVHSHKSLANLLHQEVELAGRVMITGEDVKIITYGSSLTLNINSKREDGDLITKHLNE